MVVHDFSTMTCDAKVGGSKDADREELSHSLDIKTIIDIKTNHSNTIIHLYMCKIYMHITHILMCFSNYNLFSLPRLLEFMAYSCNTHCSIEQLPQVFQNERGPSNLPS